METENLENALELSATNFENVDEDEPSMTYCLDSWIPVVHLDTGEAVVWANTVKIVLGIRSKKTVTQNISYVALPPFVCASKYQLSGVPEDGLTFAYRDWHWHPELEDREPSQDENLLPVFAEALEFLGFKSRLLPVGFKLVASSEGPILKPVVTYSPRRKGDATPR